MVALKSTVPHKPPRLMDADLRDMLDAVIRGDASQLEETRRRIIKNLVVIMAVADMAGRARFIQQLRPRRFETMEDRTIRISWGQGMDEAVSDIVRRHPELSVTGSEVAELYLAKPDAFSIAGVSVDEMLHRIQGMLTLAIYRGLPQEAFKDAAEQLLTNFARPRLETIFRTNIATSYAAGRLAQAHETPEVVGFRRVTTKDVATRPNHRAAEGQVYSKHDDRLGWYMLPFGYNCRCSDSPLSYRSAKARGLDFEGDRMITPTWPAGAYPDPRFEGSGVAQLYGIR